MVCFQFVTKGGAVIDTEPELQPSMQRATAQAAEWMEYTDRTANKTIAVVTYEGDGGVIRVSELEHVAVMPAEKMAAVYAEAEKMREELSNHE